MQSFQYLTKPGHFLNVNRIVFQATIQPDILLLIRSPKFDRESIELPVGASIVSTPFNGTVCSAAGDESPIRNNIIDLLPEAQNHSLAQPANHWSLTSAL